MTGDIAFVSNSLGFDGTLITDAAPFLPGDEFPANSGEFVSGVDISGARTFVLSVTLDTNELPAAGTFGANDVTPLATFGVTDLAGNPLSGSTDFWAFGWSVDVSTPEFDTFQLVSGADGTGSQVVILEDSQGVNGFDKIIGFDPNGDDVLQFDTQAHNTYGGNAVQKISQGDLNGNIVLNADTGILVFDVTTGSSLAEDAAVKDLFDLNLNLGPNRDVIALTADESAVFVWRVDQDGLATENGGYQTDSIARLDGLSFDDLQNFDASNLRLPEV